MWLALIGRFLPRLRAARHAVAALFLSALQRCPQIESFGGATPVKRLLNPEMAGVLCTISR